MGTTALIAIKHENQYKFCNVVYMDGYPSGFGLTFKKHIQANLDRELLLSSLDLLKVDTESQCEITHNKIISTIQEAANKNTYDPQCLWNASNSLFCEWAYILDFDTNNLEVFKGFNEKPLNKTDRFYFMQEDPDVDNYRQKQVKNLGHCYYPVKLVASFNLNQLPSDDVFTSVGERYFLAVDSAYGIQVIGEDNNNGGLDIAGQQLLDLLKDKAYGATGIYRKAMFAKDKKPLVHAPLKQSIETLFSEDQEHIFAREVEDKNHADYGFVINRNTQSLDIYTRKYWAETKYGYKTKQDALELFEHIKLISYSLDNLPTVEQIKEDLKSVKVG